MRSDRCRIGSQAPYVDHADVNGGGPHNQANAYGDIDHGRMDGFVEQEKAARKGCQDPTNPACANSPTSDVMGYHTESDIPNYWTYAKDFVLQDHMFEPNASWSEPDCVDDAALSCPPKHQSANTPGIWNPLPWFDTVKADHQLGNIQSVTNYYKAAKVGTLPAVTWMRTGTASECPAWSSARTPGPASSTTSPSASTPMTSSSRTTS